MGLSQGGLECVNCESKNTKILNWPEHQCNECGHIWKDPVAEMSNTFWEGILQIVKGIKRNRYI